MLSFKPLLVKSILTFISKFFLEQVFEHTAGKYSFESFALLQCILKFLLFPQTYYYEDCPVLFICKHLPVFLFPNCLLGSVLFVACTHPSTSFMYI